MGKQTSWMKDEPLFECMLHSRANKPVGWKTNYFLNAYSTHDNWEWWANKPVGWKTNYFLNVYSMVNEIKNDGQTNQLDEKRTIF